MPLLRPHAAALQHAASSIRLHPAVQLRLTAGQTARPSSFAHAVEAMAAGLVHDVGEMYIASEFGEAETSESLDVDSYRQLVVHPHVGHLLITQLTDYPKDIARAVAEHHERLDGSGYPHRLAGESLSPLGRLLSATILPAEPSANLLRAAELTRHLLRKLRGG